MSRKETLVVIGNGMVGYKFIEKLTDLGGAERYDIVTFCEEPRPAYDRVHLSEYFGGKTADDLMMASVAWYAERQVTLHLNDAVVEVNREAKWVRSRQGLEVAYDKVVFATGSVPFVPPVPGIEKTGVFVYRTIEDLEGMMAYGRAGGKAAVIGGGLLGLEAANAMVGMDMETEVIEFASRLMPRQIDDLGSQFLAEKIKELKVNVRLNMRTELILGEDRVEGIQFVDGEVLPVDMIVVSAGIRPRDDLAKACGLKVGERGGVCVDNQLLTSDSDIFAIGECALHQGFIYGLVAPGYRMAEVVANQLMGKSGSFEGADMSTKLKLMGVDVASVGDSTIEREGVDAFAISDKRKGVYKKISVCRETNTVKGAIFVGDAHEYGPILQMYLNQTQVPDSPLSLIVQGGAGDALAGVDALPDTAQICSCENITKGQIVEAIEGGCHTVGGIKKCTKAGTGCGSCVSLISDLITSQMEKVGLVVDKSLCEHFKYTRQELLDVVKTTGIKRYDELLGRFGTGKGCEVCKPAVASILASVWNEHVMEHNNIQDTNDRFMANIQRNGTYSVVPRVPGGEITPQQLIVIGEVARDFGLYSKITGGQRIDLFGAKVSDLPRIWARLAEVGLESGHAYAKALRTVKSCVGQQWCRFGVQDSTALAIEVENRYKGLRAPHKIKMAVSGCARECAEAQSKDVGIIATEKGWNLYVCGNGGMKPQHAILFAEDLDKETLIKYIDRLLMYYVRTADRLTRTATWLNKLPGGIDQLRDVVIKDSLGVVADLEREMQHVVDTFECEWKKALGNPEKLKEFRHFVNSDQSDPTIQFEDVRGQAQPTAGAWN